MTTNEQHSDGDELKKWMDGWRKSKIMIQREEKELGGERG